MAFNPTIAQRGINSQFEAIIQTAASQYGIEPALVKAIISVESAWDPSAVNPSDPSYGLMQLNLAFFHDASGGPIIDPESNIMTGTGFLADLFSRFGSQGLPAVISAYNAGHPISGNVAYVSDVMAYYEWFKANDSGSGGSGGGGGGITIGGSIDPSLVVGLVLVGILIFALMRE